MSTLNESQLPAYLVIRDDGSRYVTSMAKGVTLEDARAFFLGQQQALDVDEILWTTVVAVEPCDACPPRRSFRPTSTGLPRDDEM